MKGDNRLGNIFYANSTYENQKLYYSGSYTGLMTFMIEEGTL